MLESSSISQPVIPEAAKRLSGIQIPGAGVYGSRLSPGSRPGSAGMTTEWSRHRLRTQIHLDHPCVLLRLLRGAGEDHFAVVEHDDAIDHAHQHAHDVLDPHDGDALLAPDALEHVGSLLHFGMVEPIEAFV